jgi:hypothetical protein
MALSLFFIGTRVGSFGDVLVVLVSLYPAVSGLLGRAICVDASVVPSCCFLFG